MPDVSKGNITALLDAYSQEQQLQYEQFVLWIFGCARTGPGCASMGCRQSAKCSPSSNVLHLRDGSQARLAKGVLRKELELGRVEFFCGSGVGKPITGIDWIGLVNAGAQEMLSSQRGAGEEPPLDAPDELDFVRACFKAFRKEGSPEDRQAVLKRFDGSFYRMVVAYAEAVDVCMAASSKVGLPSPKTYNIFISSFMSRCHAKDICPGTLAGCMAKQILQQARQNNCKRYCVYTTNYNRAINIALLELGVTVEEIYPARFGWASCGRDDSKYGDSVQVMCSVLKPSVEGADVVIRVLHMHGIAKSLDEFVFPKNPGPSGRSKPAWSSQEHFCLGAAREFFDEAGHSVSLVELWRSGSKDITRKAFEDFPRRPPEEDPTVLFEAVAEGIVITTAQYGCKTHVDCLKGSFRAAIDDPGRTILIVGSSMTDEFFDRYLEAGLDPNTEPASNCSTDTEALKFYDPGKPMGTTISVCMKPQAEFMCCGDVVDELKPYLWFVVASDGDCTHDFIELK
jgi:hypothetical protein